MNYFINYLVLILIIAGFKNGLCKIVPTCNGGNCECPLGYLPNSEQDECLPYVTEYNGECSENSQCEWLGDNSECDNVCRCKEGYRWYRGSCRKYAGLGGDCTQDIDCFDGYNLQSLSCSSSKCVCSEGYYQRGETDCRKSALSEKDPCALDIDCKATNTICKLGKCTKAKSFLKETFEEETEEEIYTGKTANPVNCTKNEDCANISNSVCYDKTGTCICEKQYFFNSDGTSCLPELGVSTACKTDSDCPLKPGKCEDGICYCRDYYFVADGNQKCVKTMSQTNTNCLSKEWCYAWGSYVYCTSNETCSCSKTAKFDEKNAVCLWNGEKPECSADYQCNHPKNSFCVDEKCQCRGAAVIKDDTCLPGLGDECDPENLPCGVDYSECIKNKCQCKTDFVQQENACYKIKHHLGDDCGLDIQCSTGITYTECVGGDCTCKSDRIPYNDICYQKTEYGGYCNNEIECILSLNKTFGDSIKCRNRKCQCPTGYKLKENRCTSGGIIITGNFLVATVLILKSVLSVFS